MDARRGGARGRAPALPADRDDLARLRARRAAARARHRRRRRRAPLDGHRRVRRHAGRDLRRHALRAAVLRAARRGARRKRDAAARPPAQEGRHDARLVAHAARVLLLGACRLHGRARLRAARDAACPAPIRTRRPSRRGDGARFRPNGGSCTAMRTLDELVASALERNADVRSRVARIEEADAKLREAARRFLPEIDLAAAPHRSQHQRRRDHAGSAAFRLISNDIRVSLSATSFEIDFWGKLRRAAGGHARARARLALCERRGDAVARGPDHAGLFLAALARRADRGHARDAGEPRRGARLRAQPRARRHCLGSGREPGRARAPMRRCS